MNNDSTQTTPKIVKLSDYMVNSQTDAGNSANMNAASTPQARPTLKDAMMSDPDSLPPKKSSGFRGILAAFTLILVILGSAAGLYLTQENTELRKQAMGIGDTLDVTDDHYQDCLDLCNAVEEVGYCANNAVLYVQRYTCDEVGTGQGCNTPPGERLCEGNCVGGSFGFDPNRQCGTQQIDLGCASPRRTYSSRLTDIGYWGPQACNEQPPTYSCNSGCDTTEQCQTANSSFVCHQGACRLDSNLESPTCEPPTTATPTPTPTATPTPEPKQVSGKVYCSLDDEPLPKERANVPIITTDSGGNSLGTAITAANGGFGINLQPPIIGQYFAVRIAKNIRSTAPSSDPAFIGAGGASGVCNPLHENCNFLNLPGSINNTGFDFSTTVKPTTVTSACVPNTNQLEYEWVMAKDTQNNLIRNYIVRLDKLDEPTNSWKPQQISQGGNPNDYYFLVGLDQTRVGTCDTATQKCKVNTQNLPGQFFNDWSKPWNAGTYSIQITALSNYSQNSGGNIPATQLYDNLVELCSATNTKTTCTSGGLSCGERGCDANNRCDDGLVCVTGTASRNSFCAKPEFADVCKATATPNNSQQVCCQPPIVVEPPMCRDVAILDKDNNELDPKAIPSSFYIGQTIKLRCASDRPSDLIEKYQFRITQPDNTVVEGTQINPAGNSAVSQNYVIEQSGRFKAQCRLCLTGTGCQEYMEITN